MNYTRNCSITKIPFRKNIDEIIAIPTLFSNKIEFTSNIDTNIIQLPYILEGNYFNYGIFNFIDNENSYNSLKILNDILKNEQPYNWIDFNEFSRCGLFNLNNEDYIFDFFVLNKLIYENILKEHIIVINGIEKNYLTYISDGLSQIHNLNVLLVKYISSDLETNYINILTIEFIKDFMKKTGIQFNPSFFVQEYNKKCYEIIHKSINKILDN